MEYLKLIKENHIAILSIDRPKALNALSRDIVDNIGLVLEDIKNDSNIYCLIIHSEKNFAAGADIAQMADCDEEGAKAFSFTPVFDKLAEFPIPTIAAIEGYALGGGMELALCADIRIAGESAKMGFPEVTLGIFPGAGGTIRTPKLIGSGLAMEMIFSGDAISADRALSIGLVNRVVPDDSVLEEAKKLAGRISKRGPIAIRMVKDVIIHGLATGNVKEGTSYEAQQWAKLFSTDDQKEGMHAFLEKRKPEFQNK